MDPGFRQTAARWLVVVATAGIVASLLAFGRERLFIVAVIWIGLLYLPARLALEALASGPARERLRETVAGSPDRYRSHASVALVVEHIYARQIVMPRIVGRRIDEKVQRPAVAVVMWGGRDRARAVRDTAVRAVAAAEWGAGRLGGTLEQPIQERWQRIRAVAGICALGGVLVSVYEDLSGEPFAVGTTTATDVRGFVDACLDFCDQVGLDLPGPAWEPLALVPALADGVADALLSTYSTYVETKEPAPTPLRAFLDALSQSGREDDPGG